VDSLRDELLGKLLQKTKELGRQVTFSEMQEDESMPDPNKFAFYYGTFSKAAETAYLMFFRGEELVAFSERVKGVKIVSKKPRKKLDPERREFVLNEIVDLYIKNDGRMPSFRNVKKNQYISIEEYDAIRADITFSESLVRKLAEEKSGRKFLTPKERREQERIERKKKVQEMCKQRKSHTKEGAEAMSLAGKRRYLRLSDGECKAAFEKACHEAGHILMKGEIAKLSGALPGWPTLQSKLGPWYMWDELFNLPFASEDKARKAAEMKKMYQEQLENEKAPEEPLEANQTEEIVVDECAEPEKEPEIIEHDDGTVEIPIKLIVPKSVKGTVKITLKF
jgi:hypothetical protein